MQVVPDDGKQKAEDGGETTSVINGNSQANHVGGHQVQHHQYSRRKWIIFIVAVGLIVILAAVLGGVFGSRRTGSATASASTTPPSMSTDNSTSPPTQPPQRKIAALSFHSNSINKTRLYFQDNVGQIMEAANSGSNTTWSINGTGFGGKNGSAIAAAISRPGSPGPISVLYLDVNNLIHDILYTSATRKWNLGALSDRGYKAMPNSSLTAMYNQCRFCANTTMIVFQDENGFVQFGNLTSAGWTLTQLGPTLDPELGTGLALQPFYINGSADRINLYHQSSDLNMSLASWIPASANNGVDGWSLNDEIYNTIPSGSPIAAASSYSKASTGFESWIEVLSISNRGIEVNTWSGAINGWLQQYANPSVMANSTTNKRTYGDVAVTAIGSAFGIVKKNGQTDGIENWQVEDDTVDWKFIGNVDLGGAWG